MESPFVLSALGLIPRVKPLCISLERHSLRGGQLSYVALSYVWGDTSNLVPILCNGNSIAITPNLHSALLRLRDALTDQGRPLGRIATFDELGSDVCPIWIDSLCSYSHRTRIKPLRNLRYLILHLEEPNQDPFGAQKILGTKVR